jgi:hypothetical protein
VECQDLANMQFMGNGKASWQGAPRQCPP